MKLSFRQLKWISVVAPVAALTALLYVVVFALHRQAVTPLEFAVLVALLVTGAALFSRVVFAVVSRLEREIVRQRDRFATAAGVAMRLSEAEGTNEILQQVLDAVVGSFAVETGVICLLDEEADELYVCARRGVPAPILERIRRQPVGEDLVGGEVVRGGRPVVVADAAQDPRSHGLAEEFGLWSFVSVPLVAEGRALGVLALASTARARFDEEDVRLLEQIARQLGIAVQRTNLLEQLLVRNDELRLLNDASAGLSRARELRAVFSVALTGALEVAAAERAELWLDEKGQQVMAHAVGAPGPDDGGDLSAADLRHRVWEAGTAEILASGDTWVGCYPLRDAGQVFGVFVLRGPGDSAPGSRRRQLLESITDQAAVAISNARFRVRVRELAVVEERERIAREMHDGLAQVLGYVNTKAFAVRRLLKDGDTATAQEMLAQLEEAAREVYADVREGVLALRGAASGERGLLDNICDYLGKFERLSGVHVECRADSKVAALQLSEMSEIQVMRVVQEALTNVRKHAGAANATVTLRARNGTLVAQVDDDGSGFDVRSVSRRDWPQFGLQTMRERAEAIGGRFSIASSPGRGTHVVIRVPARAAAEGRE